MGDHDVALVVQEHGLFDILVELDLSDEILASVPDLDAAVATRGENEPLAVEDVHRLQGLLMLVLFLRLESVELLLSVVPLEQLEVPWLKPENHRVILQLGDGVNLSEKEVGLENMLSVVLEAPKLWTWVRNASYVQKALLTYADEFAGAFDLLNVCYALPVDREAGIDYAHIIDIYEYYAALI